MHCGQAASVSREARYYEELPEVIVDSLEVHRCAACGESIVIRRLTSLRAALRAALLQKHDRLTGEEIAFLRQSMGWMESDMARCLGADEEQIRSWERHEAPMDLKAERIFRLMVAAMKEVALPIELVAALSDQTAPLCARARLTPEGWVVEPEAKAIEL